MMTSIPQPSARWPTRLLVTGTAWFLVATAACTGGMSPPPRNLVASGTMAPVATFSIVAFDPTTGDLGVAVQSRFFAVGAVVPWARAGVGAVATQSFANTSYGPDGLHLMGQGSTAEEAVAALTRDDPGRAQRQVGLVDARGGVASFTGQACLPWAGGRSGTHYTAQGNILAGPQVVDAMAEAFEQSGGELAARLVAALAAGEAAGGDARGRQSAALLVVRAGGGYGGRNDRYIDLRVDDHPAPIRELRRLLHLRQAQLAVAMAHRLLGEGDLEGARSAARRATRLSPDDSGTWLAAAAVALQGDDTAAALIAGREAVVRDPWLKRALVAGILAGSGNDRVLEQLLQQEPFARLWATLPGPAARK